METLRTNTLMMTILMALSVTTYSHQYSANSCQNGYADYLITQQQCYSNNALELEQFEASFPH